MSPMESNIQVLLDKIYEEGISKTKSESNKILSQARLEADQIIEDAKKEASRILEKAKSDAKVLRESTEADLKTSRDQVLSSLRNDIMNLITKKCIDVPMHELSLDISFLKELVQRITEHWINSGAVPSDIELIIPENKKELWEQNLKASISGNLKDLKLSSTGIKSGFQLKRHDKGFRLDFTEESMKDLFRSFLRQKTADFLFGG